MTACPDCGGTGWLSREVDGVQRAERCHCRAAAAAKRVFESARIPNRYAKSDFKGFIRYGNDDLLHAVQRAEKFASDFPAVKKGLGFIGGPGIGKTHLAIAVLRAVLDKGCTGIYWDTIELLAEIRATFKGTSAESESAILEQAEQVDLLVLDDLAAHRRTEWVNEMMNLVINRRYSQNRPLVFTSNYGDGPIEDLDSLHVRLGYRIRSRLLGSCEFLEFEGADFRQYRERPQASELARDWESMRDLPPAQGPGSGIGGRTKIGGLPTVRKDEE